MVRTSVMLFAACSLLGAGSAVGQVVDFVINPQASGLTGTITLNASLPGTLIGNYSDTNLTGTRTKPGLFGTFGATENVAVPVTLAPGITNRTINTDLAGSFTAAISLDTNTVSITNYQANRVSSGPLFIPVTVGLTLSAFRTRNPSSTYFAATINLPVSDLTVTTWTEAQAGPSLGTLTPTATPGVYDVVAAVPVTQTLEGSVLGSPINIPPGTPGLQVITGTLTVTATGATLTTTTPLSITDTQTPGTALPAFEFPLPTILPPGSVANVLFNLTLASVNTAVNGTQTLSASGAARPQPTCPADIVAVGGVLPPDGLLTGDDFTAFINAFAAGDLLADIVAVGGTYPPDNLLTGDDFTAFINAFASGCP